MQVSDLLNGNNASLWLGSSAVWSRPAKLPDDIDVAGWFCDFVAGQPVNRDSSRSETPHPPCFLNHANQMCSYTILYMIGKSQWSGDVYIPAAIDPVAQCQDHQICEQLGFRREERDSAALCGTHIFMAILPAWDSVALFWTLQINGYMATQHWQNPLSVSSSPASCTTGAPLFYTVLHCCHEFETCTDTLFAITVKCIFLKSQFSGVTPLSTQ